jgi:hypothetical protein
LADVVMALSSVARARGVSLADAIAAKLAVCKARRWGRPDADGVVEHVRPDAPRAADAGSPS